MYIRISISYVSTRTGQPEEVTGTTDVIPVVWGGETPMRYFELKPPYSDTPVGGVHLKHKLVMEAEWENIKRMAQTTTGRRPASQLLETQYRKEQSQKGMSGKLMENLHGATVGR